MERRSPVFAPPVISTDAACDGCGACVTACAAVHPLGHAAIQIITARNGTVPLLCRHCHDAPCTDACMAGCRHHDVSTGRVVTDYERCVGCWMCLMACPFGAIRPFPATGGQHHGIALKCDGCGGVIEAPCTAACRRGVLRHVEPLQLARARRERAAYALLGCEAPG